MADVRPFLRAISHEKVGNAERAIALGWFHSVTSNDAAFTASEICGEIEKAGYGKQNASRIRSQMAKDKRTVKVGANAFRISEKARQALNESYLKFLEVVPVERTDSVLPESLFASARSYTEKVVRQLNASYHYGLFDCCAVMCRRLVETLIIESYEVAGKEGSIRDNDGNFFMLARLVAQLETKNDLSLSRNAISAVKQFKSLGDLSAHNRRFNARKTDIDAVAGPLRVACEEFLHLAGQAC